MKRRRDFYTPLLPFDEATDVDQGEKTPAFVKEPEDSLEIFLSRLVNFLEKEKNITNFPMLKLLPSLNKPTTENRQVKFSEEQAAEFFKKLGIEIHLNPSYLGRSRYRVTVSIELAKTLLKNYSTNR